MPSIGSTTFFSDSSETYVYWADSDNCSVLVTASVTLDMYPSDPACPPTTATIVLRVERPDGGEADLDEVVLRAPPYTLQSCDEGTDYPMRMNAALVGRIILSDSWGEEDADHYKFKIQVEYSSSGVHEVYTVTGEANMIIGVFPCMGYNPT